ncbi:unnamed protein product [Ambrosiozyma monospora]|uniref:Unnamed protein product n=1 Tax=Ambrosiozyma monospora TaxID=43982 RepID=A0ACB5T067_AMBMO|nr:unnamed protein product [Ambrosiozyma monospora]
MQNSSFNAPEINPGDFFCLPHLLSKYLSTSGMILHSSVTGLKPQKQRAMAKAIKRARAFGYLSSVGRDVVYAAKRGRSL